MKVLLADIRNTVLILVNNFAVYNPNSDIVARLQHTEKLTVILHEVIVRNYKMLSLMCFFVAWYFAA